MYVSGTALIAERLSQILSGIWSRPPLTSVGRNMYTWALSALRTNYVCITLYTSLHQQTMYKVS